jgi:hypothetical protein
MAEQKGSRMLHRTTILSYIRLESAMAMWRIAVMQIVRKAKQSLRLESRLNGPTFVGPLCFPSTGHLLFWRTA